MQNTKHKKQTIVIPLPKMDIPNGFLQYLDRQFSAWALNTAEYPDTVNEDSEDDEKPRTIGDSELHHDESVSESESKSDIAPSYVTNDTTTNGNNVVNNGVARSRPVPNHTSAAAEEDGVDLDSPGTLTLHSPPTIPEYGGVGGGIPTYSPTTMQPQQQHIHEMQQQQQNMDNYEQSNYNGSETVTSNGDSDFMYEARKQIETRVKNGELYELNKHDYGSNSDIFRVLYTLFKFYIRDISDYVVPRDVAVQLFVSSNLPQRTLEMVWNEAKTVDNSNHGNGQGLSSEEFTVAFLLVGLAQHGEPVNAEFLQSRSSMFYVLLFVFSSFLGQLFCCCEWFRWNICNLFVCLFVLVCLRLILLWLDFFWLFCVFDLF